MRINVGAIVVKEVSVAAIELSISKLRKEPFPEGTLPHPVALQDLGAVGAQGEGLALQGSVHWPVGVCPLVILVEGRVPEMTNLSQQELYNRRKTERKLESTQIRAEWR